MRIPRPLTGSQTTAWGLPEFRTKQWSYLPPAMGRGCRKSKSVPVKPVGIVLGKFLAAYIVFVISLLLLLIQVVIIASVSTPNIAIIVGNYIALLSVGAVFIAIGCFVSSLTENQLVANIATLAINAFLLLVDLAYNYINLAWIKRIIYWISLFRRYNTFYMGVFSVADFAFYVCAAAVFLFLTVRVLEKKRWS